MSDPMDICNPENVVTDVIAGARMDFCRACEHFDAEIITCRECGCPMNVKSWLKAAECPIGKWSQSS
jgi:hypothetical protein